MTYIIVGIIILLLVLLGEPVFVLIGAGGLLLFKLSGTDTSAVIVELYRLASLPALIAIPLFTFAGYILAESNAPKRLVRLALAFFGWMPGGLAIVSLVSTAIFTAFTGASGVTIVALGGLLFPILLSRKIFPRLDDHVRKPGVIVPAELADNSLRDRRRNKCR